MFLAVIDYYVSKKVTRKSQLSTLLFSDKYTSKEKQNVRNLIRDDSDILIIKSNKSKYTPDIGIDYGKYIVSDKFKELCEHCNVSDFDFFPVSLTDKKQNRLGDRMYLMLTKTTRDLLLNKIIWNSDKSLFGHKGKLHFKTSDLDVFQQKGIVGYLNTSRFFKEEFIKRNLRGLFFVNLETSEEPLTERLSQVKAFHKNI